MKKFGLLLGIISSLFLLNACDSGSSKPSLKDKCKKGLTKECLEGTWLLHNLQYADPAEGEIYGENFVPPSQLVLQVTSPKDSLAKEEFEFTWSPTSEDYYSHGCTETLYGKWWIQNGTLFFEKGLIEGCGTFKNFSTTATVDVTTLTFDGKYFNQLDGLSIPSLKEVFTREVAE